ncbi:MAG: DUF3810 domain-containing protein [Defluviitaleaceae bacterium]|nr:DUF3810 domain-containing protein [Defluviitaleaceae bacterium]
MKIIRLTGWAIILLGGFLLFFISHRYPAFATWYASYVFPVFQHTIGRFFGLFPFSVFEVLVILAGFGLFAGIIFTIVSLCTIPGRKKLKKHIKAVPLPILYTLSIMFLVFILTTGINYNRESFSYHVGIEVTDSSVDELVQLYLILAARAEILSGQIETDDNGHFILNKSGLHNYAIQSMHDLNSLYGGLGNFFPRAKAPFLSRFILSNSNINGVFAPWTMEAHYNGDILGQSIPFVITHELAHFAGHMREDEANFIAYLASRNSDNVDFQYSAVYIALNYTLNALRRALSTETYRELFAILPEQIHRDFAADRAYWQAFQGPVADMAVRVNDTYLRLNQQEDGVRSYGRMVDLLLAYYRNVGKISAE